LNDRTENRSGVGIDETRSRVRCSEFHRFGVLWPVLRKLLKQVFAWEFDFSLL
jgi:hypothetical protein